MMLCACSSMRAKLLYQENIQHRTNRPRNQYVPTNRLQNFSCQYARLRCTLHHDITVQIADQLAAAAITAALHTSTCLRAFKFVELATIHKLSALHAGLAVYMCGGDTHSAELQQVLACFLAWMRNMALVQSSGPGC